MSLTDIFNAYASFGVTAKQAEGSAKGMNTRNLTKWLKEAGVFNSKEMPGITSNDSDIVFSKVAGTKKMLQASDLQKFLDTLGEDVSKRGKGKKTGAEVKAWLVSKLTSAGMPSTAGATQALHMGGVDRLTDVKGYTGAHKQRFDDTGKGRGKEGRADTSDGKGYVSGYKGEATYDKTH